MHQTKSRRDILKLIALSGLGLCIPSCKFSSEKKKIKQPKDTIAVLEKELVSNNVVYLQKETQDFIKYNQGFNLRTPKNPAYIALCKNTKGVSEAIKFAIKNKLKVAVKSGGHSFEGFSSIDNGLQINLSLLNNVSLQTNTNLIAEPACLLRDLYDYLLPKQRLLPAGSCGSVGLGGLTLGGGYGFFSRKYGLTCDHIVKVTFVDGKGNIHQTTQKDTLLWALKGGGNGNFGVVTKFEFITQKAPKTFTSYRFKAYKLDKNRTKILLRKYFELSKELPNTCFAAFVLNYKTLTLLITNYGEKNTSLEKMLTVFKKLTDKTRLGKPKKLAQALYPFYGIQYPIYFKNASAGYYQGYETIETSIDEVLELLLKKRGLIYQINTLGGNIANKNFEVKSCYPHRNQPFLSELQAYWKKDKNPLDVLERFAKIQEVFYKNGVDKQYRNYPNIDFKNWETAYFGKNYKVLKMLKQQYDPYNLFSNKQTIKA